MNKDTLQSSWDLVYGVAKEVKEYLFEDLSKWRDERDMLESIDSAIQELESWKKAVEDSSKSGYKKAKEGLEKLKKSST